MQLTGYLSAFTSISGKFEDTQLGCDTHCQDPQVLIRAAKHTAHLCVTVTLRSVQQT